MRRVPAAAKLNLALVVGPVREDGRHELVTVFQRVDLADRVALVSAPELAVTGWPEDTLVTEALTCLAAEAGAEPAWAVRIWKRIPVAAGLGGGSSDAAAALRLANETLERPLSAERLRTLASELGADVPFFLEHGPQLGTGDGGRLEPLDLPQDYWVVLLLPHGAAKRATGDVYRAFDERDGSEGFEARRVALVQALGRVRRPRHLAELPPNDLDSSPHVARLRELGAFRADVSGAGPVVYALFQQQSTARAARRAIRSLGRSWLTVPAWYF